MANKGLKGNYFIPDVIKQKLQSDIDKGLGGKNRRRIIGYLNDGHLTDREMARLLYDSKYNNLGTEEDLKYIERLVNWAQREIKGKSEHIERTKKSQSDIGLENKHKKTHFKWGDDTKPIQFKNLKSIPKPEKMFESTQNISTTMKTKKDLIDILTTANQSGFVIILDKPNSGHFVNNPANLNITTYGYKNSEGIDITEGKDLKDFIGLPFYTPILLSDDMSDNENGSITVKSMGKSLTRNQTIFPIGKFITMLESFPDNSILVSFDGYLIDNIKLIGNQVAYSDTYMGGVEIIKTKPNDFVILTKGEKLQSFLRPEVIEKKIQEEITRSKQLMK